MKLEHKAQRPGLVFGEKPGLLRLLRAARGGEKYAHYDGGETYPSAGCLIGNNCLCLLSGGTMLSCRRFPKIVGRLPEDNLENVLLKNPVFKRYRRPNLGRRVGNAWLGATAGSAPR